MADPDLAALADLVDAFAKANEEFKKTHREDYDSEECRVAYFAKERARCALHDALYDALEMYPYALSVALRCAPGVIIG